MSRSLRSAAWLPALLLLAGPSGRGAEDKPAPLEESKRELKALQSDQHLRRSGAAASDEKLQVGLPRLQTGGDAPAGLPSSPSAQTTPNEPNKDWLLNGMDALEKSAKTRGGKTGKGSAEDDPELLGAVDFSDPAYLLKTYEAQRAKSAGLAGVGFAATDFRAVNPLEAYLSSWMQTTGPNAGKEGATGVLHPRGSATPGDAAGSGFFEGAGLPADDNRRTTLEAKSEPALNPFLQSVELPSARASGTPANLGAKNGFHPPETTSKASAVPALSGPEDNRPKPDRNYVPLPLNNDKKYFPQLKRF